MLIVNIVDSMALAFRWHSQLQLFGGTNRWLSICRLWWIVGLSSVWSTWRFRWFVRLTSIWWIHRLCWLLDLTTLASIIIDFRSLILASTVIVDCRLSIWGIVHLTALAVLVIGLMALVISKRFKKMVWLR